MRSKLNWFSWTRPLLKPNYVLCFALALALALAFTCEAGAASLFGDSAQVDPATRETLIRRADVWFSPSWIQPDGRFAPDFDPRKAPTQGEEESILRADDLSCAFTFTKASRGANPKFHCTISRVNHRPLKIKVKYGAMNGEVRGEVLSARLLWALGFGADREFFVSRVTCHGCGDDPVHQTAALPSSTLFSPAAIERKFSGVDVVKKDPAQPRVSLGWGFEELAWTSPDSKVAAIQVRDREALKLLAIFMNHVDNRKSNQRLVCVDGLVNGFCTGRTAMILQDVGSTFGGGYSPQLNDLIKVDFETWKAKPIWDDVATCTASVSPWGSQNLKSTKISESGRAFLASLLRGFSADRARVEKLFSVVAIEGRGGHSAEEWANVFLEKVEAVAKARCP